MTDTEKPPTRMKELEAWWAFVARIVAFLFGGYLIFKEQGPPPGVEWAIVVTGVGCMGPAIATQVAMLLEAARGGRQ